MINKDETREFREIEAKVKLEKKTTDRNVVSMETASVQTVTYIDTDLVTILVSVFHSDVFPMALFKLGAK